MDIKTADMGIKNADTDIKNRGTETWKRFETYNLNDLGHH